MAFGVTPLTDERKTMYLMSTMSDIDVRAINLNLLPALEALLAEGSVSGAARRTHVSQSAMSHSLGKLRELFGDPLLVPSGRRLVPTPRALRLATMLPHALDRLAEAVAPPEPFDARTSERRFRIATLDYFELTTLPDVLDHLGKHAPGIRLEIERFSAAHIPALAMGEIDLALVGGSLAIPLAGIRRASLYEDPYAVIARADHPRIGRRLDLETYLALGHVLVTVEGRREGAVDRALAKLGRQRTVALRVPHFVSAPLAVLRSDYVCTIASSVARRAHELFGVRVMPPPLSLPAAPVVALWPRRHDDDPASSWLRAIIQSGRAASPYVRGLIKEASKG
jgi:DNA-binding transcriptional LysR family regulator